MVGLTFSLETSLLHTFGVFVGPLTAEFGWTRTQLSGALALSQYTAPFAAPVWSLLIDRFGPRAVMLPSVGLMSLLIGLLGLIGQLRQNYLIFITASFYAGGASPIGYAAVLIRKLGRHLGLALVGVSIGATVLPPLSATLIGDVGWRGAYAVLRALTIGFTVPVAVLATRGAGRPERGRADASASPVLPLVRSRAFVLMCGIISIGILTGIVPIMIDRGFTSLAAAQLAGLMGLAAIAGRGGIGWVLDRVHSPLVVAALAMAAFGALLLVAYGSGPLSSAAMAILLGGVVGGEVDFAAFLVRRYFGTAVFGRLYGIAFGILLIDTGTGPVPASASSAGTAVSWTQRKAHP